MARSMPPAWEASFLSYELAEDAAGHSPRSIANRRSAVCSLACWLAEHEGIQSPADVTVPMTQRYFKHAYTVRERSGIRTHYNDLRAFFKHEAAESAKTDQPRSSPMDSIPRPRDVVTPAPILDGKQFAAILASVSGRNFHSLRDRAMILMFAESGMRRAELAARHLRRGHPRQDSGHQERQGRQAAGHLLRHADCSGAPALAEAASPAAARAG